jgi:hypothetical protein
MVEGNIFPHWFGDVRGGRADVRHPMVCWRRNSNFCVETTSTGWSDVPVAESAVAPPGPIPNPVVTRGSAGEYCRGDSVGGEAAAGTSDQRGD